MVGINGYSKSNNHLDAVHTDNAKRAGGVKAKNGEGKLSKKAADFLAKLKEENHPYLFKEKQGGYHVYALFTSSTEEFELIASKVSAE